MSAAMEFSLGTQERVRKSRGKRAIGIRATEVLLYFCLIIDLWRGVKYTSNEADNRSTEAKTMTKM